MQRAGEMVGIEPAFGARMLEHPAQVRAAGGDADEQIDEMLRLREVAEGDDLVGQDVEGAVHPDGAAKLLGERCARQKASASFQNDAVSVLRNTRWGRSRSMSSSVRKARISSHSPNSSSRRITARRERSSPSRSTRRT